MLPNALILDVSSNELSKSLIQELTASVEDRQNACLKIDCKYYTADVTVKQIDASNDEDHDVILSDADAILICIDPLLNAGWDLACKWQQWSAEFDLSIQILVCDRIPEGHVQNAIVDEAVKNHFEVIQLNPLPNDTEEDEEYGMTRLLSALQAHQWPGLRLKRLNSNNLQPKGEDNDASGTIRSSETECDSEKISSQSLKKDNSINKSNNRVSDIPFESLFPKLLEMKSKSENLMPDDRRKLAEQMTQQFWKALKFDPDEVDGLSSSEDENG